MTAPNDVRRRRLAERLPGLGVEGVLITRLVNVRYLTGFTGSSAALLVRADASAVLATDGRYQDQAGEECPDVDLLVTRSGPERLVERARGEATSALGFEAHDLSVAAHRRLDDASPGLLVALEPVVEPLRSVKDAAELELLTRACRVSDQALAQVLPRIRVGLTEREVALELELAMRRLGADGVAFESIVAAGPHSAIPHHSPTDRPIERGDLLKIDFGALVDGYHADETRTFVVGAEPADWQRDLHALVRDAQSAGIAALHAAADGVSVDKAARDVVQAAGMGDHFTHGLGHGVGLEIHEAPFLGPSSTDRLAAEVPVTVEPGVYLPGRGGVRIEDTLLVGAAGTTSMTTTPRELLVLDPR